MIDTKRAEIQERLSKVFRQVFDDDTIEVFDAMTVEDIDDWDSITHIVLIVAVEKEFAITLNAVEVVGLKNVGELMDTIKKHVV